MCVRELVGLLSGLGADKQVTGKSVGQGHARMMPLPGASEVAERQGAQAGNVGLDDAVHGRSPVSAGLTPAVPDDPLPGRPGPSR